GFRTHNYDGYVGTIEWGEGSELLGVLSHVDVVPAGDLSAWNSDPFTLTERDGMYIGRGVADDKGPLLSCLYGMYALKQMGLHPRKRVRFIIGTNEETGWGCIHYYKEHHMESPTESFSPDGMYTVVNREKGIYTGTFSRQVSTACTIHAGEASNLVPAHAEAVLPADADETALRRAAARYGAQIAIAADGTIHVTTKGRNAPSHTPKNGVSAITPLLAVLSEAAAPALQDACRALLSIANGTDGAQMGIACEDEPSGSLTANLGLLSLEEGTLTATFDVRTPVTRDIAAIAEAVASVLSGLGFTPENQHCKAPLYVPSDTPLIQALCGVYETVTNTAAVLYSIGGGTYARAFDNCVCFGAVYPGEDLTVHSPNERTAAENIIKNTKMYGLAIYDLAIKKE
ncbi:MAG: Sapep family Mn(2+)-dependent dipeptidase, partial [Oscillospiraceae bacterium]|nr:Sapep family Mn(2+)-dependent dipeptidase [Oscillospiraceae bacterium]